MLKSKFFTLILASLQVGYIIVLSSFFISGNFILEIISSFTPYWLCLTIVFLILLIIYLIFIKQLKTVLKSNLFITLIILSISFAAISTYKIGSFYYLKPPPQTTSGKELKITFFNTLFDNENYDLISREIRKTNPDILGLAELTPDRITKIEVLKEYPYSITDLSSKRKETGIFSKYPLERLSEIDSDTDYFTSGKILVEDKNYTIIVAHPWPPINQPFFEIRKQVLNTLVSRINNGDVSNTILMGDFNLTPWSPTYTDFTNSLSKLKNTAEGQGINRTWSSGPLNLHIDYIFVPLNARVEEFRVIGNAGSDHWIVFTRIVLP